MQDSYSAAGAAEAVRGGGKENKLLDIKMEAISSGNFRQS
eukprot:COSAG01_NODE_54374_length_332_cov_1.094421_2_plen_39_part_01